MVTYTNEFVEKLEKEINENMNNIFEDDVALNRVARLMSIYANVKVIKAQEMQITMMQQSQEIFKNTDMSKLDLNGLLSMLKGS
jgi:hypothetical protein